MTRRRVIVGIAVCGLGTGNCVEILVERAD